MSVKSILFWNRITRQKEVYDPCEKVKDEKLFREYTRRGLKAFQQEGDQYTSATTDTGAAEPTRVIQVKTVGFFAPNLIFGVVEATDGNVFILDRVPDVAEDELITVISMAGLYEKSKVKGSKKEACFVWSIKK